MLLLTLAQNIAWNPSLKIPFLLDYSEICRFVICAPLLIYAEAIIEPWLRNVVMQFKSLLASGEESKFDDFVARVTRTRDLVIVELILLCFALLRPHFDSSIAALHSVPSWQNINGVESWAQTYSMFIAKPLMGWLWLRWLWKYVLWSWLLIKIATLNLRLIPTHPDDTAGLGFVAIGQTKFSMLAFAFSVLAFGNIADDVIYQGGVLMHYRWIVMAVVTLGLVVFMTPLLAFTPKLIECKRNGLFVYGQFAQDYVEKFNNKWIIHRDQTDEDVLGHADIQTLADIENAYAIVQRMKIVIVDRSLLLSFALAALIPFAPLLLTVYQLDDLIDKVFKNIL